MEGTELAGALLCNIQAALVTAHERRIKTVLQGGRWGGGISSLHNCERINQVVISHQVD